MNDHDKLAYGFICVLMVALFLDWLGLVLYFVVFKGKTPVDPREGCTEDPNDCEVCGGDLSKCPLYIEALTNYKKETPTEEVLPSKEVARAGVPQAAHSAAGEVRYTPTNLSVGP